MPRFVDNELLPADVGLSGLGTLMRLGGGVFVWMSLYGIFVTLLTKAPGAVAVVLLLGLGRSGLHVRAGRALAGVGPGAIQKAWIYVGAALLHTAVIYWAVRDLSAVGPPLLLVGFSAAWPIVVGALLIRAPVRRIDAWAREKNRRVFAEDLGITGVAALMAVMGPVGAALVAFWLILMVSMGVMAGGFFGWLALIIGLGFLVRSGLQARAGIGFLRRADPRAFRGRNDQYFLTALLTTIVVCIITLFAGMMSGGLFGMLVLIPVAGILMTWPSIVRDAGSVELRPDLDEDDQPPAGVARDNGLVTLGMVLLAWGSLGAVSALLQSSIDGVPMGGGLGAMMAANSMPIWAGLLTSASAIWAGVELVNMSPRRKAAAVANLVLVGVSTIIMLSQTSEVFGQLGGFSRRSMMPIQTVGLLVIQAGAAIALPAVVVVQVLRPTPEPGIDLEEVF